MSWGKVCSCLQEYLISSPLLCKWLTKSSVVHSTVLQTLSQWLLSHFLERILHAHSSLLFVLRLRLRNQQD